jgi:hypothetical protein
MTSTTMPLVRIENTGVDQQSIPFTFGQIFIAGHMQQNDGLEAKLSDGSNIPLQIDTKATHRDGSLRHAILSGVLPKLAAGATETLQLVKVKKFAAMPLALTKPDGAAEIAITIDGEKYLPASDLIGVPITWLSGEFAAEQIVDLPLVDSKGDPHLHLTMRAAMRRYSTDHARVEIIFENTKTFEPGANDFKYDVAIKAGGKTIFEKKALTHYHHARWRHVFWYGDEPQIHIKHDVDYLIASKAVPNYDRTATPVEKNLSALSTGKAAPMTVGPINKAMGTTGGRPDIGPLPSWYVMYLLSADARARAPMMAAAEGSGAWSIHYRDEETGYPVRTDNEKNRLISTHMNLAKKGPLPVPRFAGNKNTLATPYKNDTAHQPSLAYLPYLLTGEYYFLEELHFWATSNSLETDPGNRGYEKGLIHWQQVRGQAWSLRTLGHAAYITPDDHPLKDYFTTQLENNIAFYHETYVVGNPNKIGVYDGSGKGSFQVKASAPWQDDYFTWSFGNLVELGFEKALPILEWKAKYTVGRMTTPGFCWIAATAYHMEYRPSAKEPIFDNLADMYRFNFGGDSVSFESKKLTHPKGLKFIDQPCGSQEQADWLTATHSYGWPPGRMVGYSDSVLGYPANMQPALAMAAQYGVKDAAEAWVKFDNRAKKPDYRTGPQFAIIPRAADQVVEPDPEPVPQPDPEPVPQPEPKVITIKLTIKVSVESGTVDVVVDQPAE